jgi:hypothetical protein
LEEAKKWAAEWNMSIEDVLASQDERFPKAAVAPKPKFVMGAFGQQREVGRTPNTYASLACMVPECYKEWENNDCGESPTGVLRPTPRDPFRF